MKRCPQCEFIYEDDQSLCDMDGILLVLDSQQLPKPKYESKSKWRGRVVTGLAAIVLATVLLMVFYVSPQSQRSSGTSFQPGGSNQPPSEVKTESAIEKVEEKPVEKPPAAKAESPVKPKSENVPKASPKPSQSKTTAKKAPSVTRNQTTVKNNDSRLGSLMKKTGKILRKPFRF